MLPLDFVVASMETSPQFVQIVPGNDTIVLVLFEIRMGEFQGAMSLCIPYLLIKPILTKLNAQRWFVSDRKKNAAAHGPQLAQRLNTTAVPCIARLGVASLTVADLVALEVGQVVPMRVCPAEEVSGARPERPAGDGGSRGRRAGQVPGPDGPAGPQPGRADRAGRRARRRNWSRTANRTFLAQSANSSQETKADMADDGQ